MDWNRGGENIHSVFYYKTDGGWGGGRNAFLMAVGGWRGVGRTQTECVYTDARLK